jgi:pilus assembly protein CpaB
MRRTAWILTGAALVVGLVTVGIGLGIVQQAAQVTGEQLEVLVAQKEVPQFTVLRRDNIGEYFRRTRLPVYYFNRLQGLVKADEDLDGWVVMVPIPKDSVLAWSMLDRNLGLEPGRRAVAISVNSETGLSGLIRPGNRVDVLVSMEGGADGGGQTVVMLQNIRVLAVSNLLPREGELTGATIGRLLPSGQLAPDMVIILDLSLEEAARLTYMRNFAKEIRFVLRRFGDEKEEPSILIDRSRAIGP